jgi:hypothetical protein
MNKKITLLHQKITEIKKKLLAIDSMRPGKLSQQQRKNSKGEMYGSYWQLGYTYKARVKSYYIPDDLIKTVQDQNDEYRKFKKLTEEWVEIAIEIAQNELEEIKKKMKKRT